MKKAISNRPYLEIYKSKCYEIFAEACIHVEECPHQISARPDDFLIDSNGVRIDPEAGPDFLDAGAWAPTRARSGLSEF